MKRAHIRFSSISKASFPKFITLANSIARALSLHQEVFGDPPFAPALLKEQVERLAYLQALAESADGTHNIRNERNLLRNEIYNKLIATGTYVLSIAEAFPGYDEKKAIVQLASFPLAFATYKRINPVPIEGVRISVSTVVGVRTVQLRWKRGECKTYVVEGFYGAVTPDSKWESLHISHKSKCEILLPHAGQWSLRVAGLFAAGRGEPSNPVTFIMG